jgi:amidohydrolase family protein/IPT/TIG domain-containing protein
MSPKICVSLLAGLLISLASLQTTQAQSLVLKGATVIDGTGSPAVPDAVIVIEQDRIKSLGGKNTTYPSDATVLDVAGKFIIPGLVDSHVHYQPWLGEIFLNHGVTSVMIPGGDVSVADREVSYRNTTRAPRIFASGGRVPIQPGMSREQVRTAIREWVTSKTPDYASPTVFNDRTAQVYAWAAEDIHDAGLVWFGHTENAPASIKAGQDVIEHVWGFAEALMSPQELEGFQKGEYLHWGSFLKDSARVDATIKDAVQRGVYLNPTMVYELGSLSSLARKHETDAYNLYRDPALMTYYPENLAYGLLLKFRSIRNFSTRYENLVPISRLSSSDLQEFREAYRLCGEFLKKWVQAGGKIMGGTDDPNVGTSGLSLHMEMAMLVESGLTPMQALQAQTSWGAEMLTARRKTAAGPPIGLIAPGAFADLVVLGANPLENIDNSRKIERVMKGGKFVELGFTPYYSAPARRIETIPSIPEPEISSITPHAVVEGTSEFEVVVEGVGFVSNSVVKVDDVPVPTTFVNIRTLKAKIPGAVVAKALPNRFIEPGPEQRVGIYGDRTVKITVFNGPPDGGKSNFISLRVIAKWMAGGQD